KLTAVHRCSSEAKFHTKLNKPAWSGLIYFAEIGGGNVHIRVAPLRAVQQVEHLSIEFERRTFVQLHALAQADVLMPDAEAASVARSRRRVAERIGLRRSERVGIEQAVASRIEIGVADIVSSDGAEQPVRPLAVVEDGQPVGLGRFQRSAALV